MAYHFFGKFRLFDFVIFYPSIIFRGVVHPFYYFYSSIVFRGPGPSDILCFPTSTIFSEPVHLIYDVPHQLIWPSPVHTIYYVLPINRFNEICASDSIFCIPQSFLAGPVRLVCNGLAFNHFKRTRLI